MAEIFRDKELMGAVFEDVSLSSARFTNVNLSGAQITESCTRGMTIDGFDVTALIEAERERISARS
jgi:uncharacterized protein YjbI with pentapeptide repeats